MSRKKKFIRNCIFILIFVIVLLGKYYLSGYYFSKEECLEQLKNTLYLQDNIVLEDIQDDEIILFVLMDEKDETFSFVRMEEFNKHLYRQTKIGFDGYTNETYGELRMEIQKDHTFDYYSTYIDHGSEYSVHLIHRNDPNIDTIKLPFYNGDVRVNMWNHDYIIMISKDYVDETKTIKAYDKNNQLIEEVEYQKFFDHFWDGPGYFW